MTRLIFARRYPLILPFLLSGLFVLTSCQKDKHEEGILAIEFKAKMNGKNLVIKTEQYTNVSGYKIKFETLRCYLSNLKLLGENQPAVLLKEVEFLDFVYHHHSDTPRGEQVVVAAPVGKYKALRFGIGVDPYFNNADPSVYPEEHPLSIYRGEHWDWNTGYIFFKLEGRYDTAGINADLAPFFLFHLGLNELYMEKEFSRPITIRKDDTTRIRIIVDADRFFYNEQDTINLATDHNTQTTDNLPLAQRMKNMVYHALYIE